MARRGYAGGANKPTLTSPALAGDTLLHNTAPTGWPTSGVAPIAVAIDRGLATEEKMLVTAYTSSTMTVTRAYDGTTAQAHASSAPVELIGSSIDFDESNAHVNATSDVHGVTGRIVGRTSTDTLTGKTMDGTQNTFTNIPLTAVPDASTGITANAAAIAAETTARGAADTTLQGNITTEAGTRATADATNATAIANEVTNRGNAITTEVANRNQAIQDERTATATLTNKAISDAGSTILGLAGNKKIVAKLSETQTTNASGDIAITVAGLTTVDVLFIQNYDGITRGNLTFEGRNLPPAGNVFFVRVLNAATNTALNTLSVNYSYFAVGS